MGADHQHVAVGEPGEERFAGRPALCRVVVGRTAPFGARHLARVVNAVARDERFLAAGGDAHADVAGRMARGRIKPERNGKKMAAKDSTKMQFRLCGTKFLISAANMERAVKFYRDVIGLDVRTSSPGWSELTVGTAVVALHGGGTGEFRRTGLSFTVDDINRACEAVVHGGGSVRSDPEDRNEEGIYLAELTDTEGNGFMMSRDKV